MIVAADTSPINYLVLIKEIDILPRMYGEVVNRARNPKESTKRLESGQASEPWTVDCKLSTSWTN